MPKISIIIPVYNIADYIEQCVKSIQDCSEQDYEIIIVDDGSTDGSDKVCETLASQDTRIHFYHKTNGGVSSARNLGIDVAKGEWVSFIDGDDKVSSDFLSIPVELEDCDVIQKGRVSTKGEIIFSTDDNIIIGQNNIFKYFIHFGFPEITNRLFKREVIGQDRFATNIPIGEDGLFFFTILHKVKKWGFTSVGKYIYFIRSSSAMGSTAKQRRINIWFDLCDAAFEIATKKHCLKLYENYIAGKYIPSIWSEKENLTPIQKAKFKKIMSSLSTKNLSLLSWKHCVKYLLIRIHYSFKQL